MKREKARIVERTENVMSEIEKALRARFPKHAFEKRLEIRFVIDKKYLSRTALQMGLIENLIKARHANFENVASMFDWDVADLEGGRIGRRLAVLGATTSSRIRG